MLSIVILILLIISIGIDIVILSEYGSAIRELIKQNKDKIDHLECVSEKSLIMAHSIARKQGLSMHFIVNALITHMAQEKEIPFNAFKYYKSQLEPADIEKMLEENS